MASDTDRPKRHLLGATAKPAVPTDRYIPAGTAIVGLIGGSQLVISPGQAYTVGRAKAHCDLLINDNNVSRTHGELSYHPERQGWCYRDFEHRTNPSFIDGHRAAAGVLHHLSSWSDLRVAGHHRLYIIDRSAEVAEQILDPETHLVFRSVFERELYRQLRTSRRDRPLAVFDIDRFGELKQRLGVELSNRIRRELGQVLGLWSQTLGVEPLLFGNEEDKFFLGLPADAWSDASLVGALEQARQQVASQTLEPHRASLSAALVMVPASSPEPRVLSGVRNKVIQAKIGGGSRFVAGGAVPHWYRGRLDEWKGELRKGRHSSSAIISPRRPTADDPLCQVRTDLVLAIDALPMFTDVRIAWSQEAVLISCGADERTLADALSPLRRSNEITVAQPGTVKWVEGILEQLRRRTARHTTTDPVLSTALARIVAARPEQQAQQAMQQFERCLAYLAWTACAATLSPLVDQPSRARARLRKVPLQIRGAGSWLRMIRALLEGWEMPRLPGSLHQLLAGDWLERAEKATHYRNEVTHRGGPADLSTKLVRAVQEVLQELSAALSMGHWELWRIDAVESVRRSSMKRVSGRVLRTIDPEYQPEYEVQADIGPGTWWHDTEGGGWIRLTPFLHHATCPDCAIEDLFICDQVPARKEPLQLIAHGGHRLTWEADEHDDLEFLTFVGAMPAPVGFEPELTGMIDRSVFET
ncbi:MAG: FHA domain-containing protein [Deltaproteobacteria bacterium]|nr:FHA domain-containing protein [Deltaproteobacteria bacterium]